MLKFREHYHTSGSQGFTLLEILLVVAAIAILAGIVIFAINPAKQLADTRNAQRRTDINTLLNAVHQYAIDHAGQFPDNVPVLSPNEICRSGASDCNGLVDLFVLTNDGKYLVGLPADPNGATTNGSGYNITKDNNNRITVAAPHAENGETISASR